MATPKQTELAATLGIDITGLSVGQAWNMIHKTRRCLELRKLLEQGLKVGSRVKVHGKSLLHRVVRVSLDTQAIYVTGKQGGSTPTASS